MKAAFSADVRTALLGVVCVLFLWSGIWLIRECLVRYDLWGFDLDFRYNEISCAHGGTDPFDVWNRTVVSDRYRGWKRPDKPEEPADGRLKVHAYPAWHTAMCWWYGWVPRWACHTLMGALYAAALVLAARWCAGRLAPSAGRGLESACFLLAVSLHPLGGICLTMNYGLLLLGCILLTCHALDCGREAWAGVAFSAVMIKPQIGLLLAVPLLVGRKWKTLAVAAAVCMAGTLFAAVELGKPPVELLLQIPKIGAPYGKGLLAEWASTAAGGAGPFAVMAAFGVLVAAGSLLVRKAPEAWMRFVPALAAIPFWTYSQPHDWLVTVPCFVCLLRAGDERRWLRVAAEWLAVAWGGMVFAEAMHWYFPLQRTLSTAVHMAILLACCWAAVAESRAPGPFGRMEERKDEA